MNASDRDLSSAGVGPIQALVQGFMRRFPDEVADELEQAPVDEVLQLLQTAPIEQAAETLRHANPDAAVGWFEQMDGTLAARLLEAVDPTHGAFLLSRVDDEVRQRFLEALPAPLKREFEELMSYPLHSAGQLMDTRVALFSGEETVEEALGRIRSQPDRAVPSLCLVDGEGRLTGVLPLQSVAVAQPQAKLSDLEAEPPFNVQTLAPRDEVVQLLEERKLSSLPVVGFDGKLLGVIRHDALVEAAQQEATEGMQAMVGAGRGEGALSKASFAIRKRLPWLQINLVTAFMASGVVGMFEDTIARITALAVFLPVVAGQSGNTGAQALAVTMRGLALREIRVRHWLKVAGKEVTVGFVNGCAVAATTAGVVYFWTSSGGMALVIGVAMVFSMVMAGLSGAVIPMVLTSLRQDPAQSASIVLTTVTDIVGFMSFLGLATLLSGMLV